MLVLVGFRSSSGSVSCYLCYVVRIFVGELPASSPFWLTRNSDHENFCTLSAKRNSSAAGSVPCDKTKTSGVVGPGASLYISATSAGWGSTKRWPSWRPSQSCRAADSRSGRRARIRRRRCIESRFASGNFSLENRKKKHDNGKCVFTYHLKSWAPQIIDSSWKCQLGSQRFRPSPMDCVGKPVRKLLGSEKSCTRALRTWNG